jgi:two-component system chemotaxis sensor kinase CheA
MTTIDAEFAEVTREFVAEGMEILDRLEDAAIALEERPADGELIRSIFRGAHTLKGNASCLGLAEMSRTAHELENAVDLLRNQKAVADSEFVTLMLRMVDVFRQSVPAAGEGRDEVAPDAAPAVEALHRWTESRLRDSASGSRSNTTDGGRSSHHLASPHVRVDTDRLDQLIDLCGELGIARGRLGGEIEATASTAAVEAFAEAERLSQQIQDLATRLRMVPVGTIFRPLVRTVRDLAAAEGKKARVMIEGGEVEVDLSVIEHLRDPLMHMIRNAVDHGLESPDERIARGKPAEGRITLRARHEAGRIVIDVHDDGRGFDLEAVARRAGEIGLDPAKMTPRELLRLVLEPGFSTAREVTRISGRGVGLDVVRRNVEALHGSIDIRDEGGACFTLRLPLTLAIVDGFVVSVAGEPFIIPLASTVECAQISELSIEGEGGSGVADLRGEPLPVADLGTALGITSHAAARHLVVVESCAGRAGLVVDTLEGLRPSVIKPLGGFLGRLPMFSGSSVLSDGRVALVLDVPTLVDSLLRRPAREKTSCD